MCVKVQTENCKYANSSSIQVPSLLVESWRGTARTPSPSSVR